MGLASLETAPTKAITSATYGPARGRSRGDGRRGREKTGTKRRRKSMKTRSCQCICVFRDRLIGRNRSNFSKNDEPAPPSNEGCHRSLSIGVCCGRDQPVGWVVGGRVGVGRPGFSSHRAPQASQGRLVPCAPSDQVDVELELEELADVVVDRAAPQHGPHDAREVVIQDHDV